MFASKNGEMSLFRQCFKAEVKFLAKNSYPDLHHLQGGMKFDTQISPLLNYYIFSIQNCLAYILEVAPVENEDCVL